MYIIKPSKQYKKDLRLLVKQQKDLSKLEEVIDTLAQGKALPKKYVDHALKGKLKHMRECHIEPNWLLLYEKDGDSLLLYLLKTGTHKHVLGIE